MHRLCTPDGSWTACCDMRYFFAPIQASLRIRFTEKDLFDRNNVEHKQFSVSSSKQCCAFCERMHLSHI